MDSIKKQVFYKWVKLGGMLSFIPIVLAAGAIAGYFLGDYLTKRFNFPAWTSLVLMALGFAGSVRETIRIIRIALKTEKGL